MVVVSALHREHVDDDEDERTRRTVAYPSPLFILGKVLDALLLHPINIQPRFRIPSPVVSSRSIHT